MDGGSGGVAVSEDDVGRGVVDPLDANFRFRIWERGNVVVVGKGNNVLSREFIHASNVYLVPLRFFGRVFGVDCRDQVCSGRVCVGGGA